MTRRERLIRALIHFHQHPADRRRKRRQRNETLSALRSKIAERDQYEVTKTKNNH